MMERFLAGAGRWLLFRLTAVFVVAGLLAIFGGVLYIAQAEGVGGYVLGVLWLAFGPAFFALAVFCWRSRERSLGRRPRARATIH